MILTIEPQADRERATMLLDRFSVAILHLESSGEVVMGLRGLGSVVTAQASPDPERCSQKRLGVASASLREEHAAESGIGARGLG